MTPEDRILRARIGAHTRWARTDDPTAATAPARRGFNARFEREVDPDGTLAPAERERRAEHARKAYFTRLALRSARSRRKAKEARQLDATGTEADPAAEEATPA